MSISALREAFDQLPYSLLEQVIGYAQALDSATTEIFKEAGVKWDRKSADNVVFLGGLKKLLSIVDSNYWILDNAGTLLNKQNNELEIRVGGTDLSKDGAYHYKVRKALDDLNHLLTQHELFEMVRTMSYTEIARAFRDGR